MEKNVAKPLTNKNAIIGRFNGCARRLGEWMFPIIIALIDQMVSIVKANI
jgi:hypothetical protein